MKSLEKDKEKPWLEKYGKFGHTILLYLLTGFIYLGVWFIMHHIFYGYDILKDPMIEANYDWYFYVVLGSYFGAPLVYGVLLYLYYNVTHISFIFCNFLIFYKISVIVCPQLQCVYCQQERNGGRIWAWSLWTSRCQCQRRKTL